MYLDSAYIAKYYVNERDSDAVRKLIGEAAHVCSSAWAVVEVSVVFQRHVREGSLSARQANVLADLFREHVEENVWNFVPVTETLLRATATLIRGFPAGIPLRAGDAIHIATALHSGEDKLYTNDRHLLKAAAHFGLAARSVTGAGG